MSIVTELKMRQLLLLGSNQSNPKAEAPSALVADVIAAIGRATKRSAKATWRGLVAAWKYLLDSNAEAIEIHNRIERSKVLDPNYAYNLYYLRGSL